jgi:hypothetical protein
MDSKQMFGKHWHSTHHASFSSRSKAIDHEACCQNPSATPDREVSEGLPIDHRYAPPSPPEIHPNTMVELFNYVGSLGRPSILFSTSANILVLAPCLRLQNLTSEPLIDAAIVEDI